MIGCGFITYCILNDEKYCLSDYEKSNIIQFIIQTLTNVLVSCSYCGGVNLEVWFLGYLQKLKRSITVYFPVQFFYLPFHKLLLVAAATESFDRSNTLVLFNMCCSTETDDCIRIFSKR